MKSRRIAVKVEHARQLNGRNDAPSKPTVTGSTKSDAQLEREMLRIVILQITDDACPRAVSLSVIHRKAQRETFGATRPAVAKENSIPFGQGAFG